MKRLGVIPMLICLFCISIFILPRATAQKNEIGIEELKKQLAELKLVKREEIDKTQTARELHKLFYTVRADVDGRIEKILKHEEALKKHLSIGLLNEMNKKLDQVMIFEAEEEVIVRASTFRQLNAVLDQLKEMQNRVTADFIKENEVIMLQIAQRLKAAQSKVNAELTEKNQTVMLQIAEYEGYIANKNAELAELEQAEANYLKEQAGKLGSIKDRMAAVKKRIAGKVDLQKEQDITMFELLLDRIEELEAANKKLKK